MPKIPTSPEVRAYTTLGNLKCHCQIDPTSQYLSEHLND